MEAVLVHAIIQAVSSQLVVLAASGAKKIYKLRKAKYDYVNHMSNNLANLERELKALSDRAEEEEARLIRNKRKFQLTPSGKSWFEGVKKIKDEVKELKIKYKSRSTRKFLIAVFPAPGSVKLGKQIVETTDKVVYLKNQIHEITIMVEKEPASSRGKIPKFFRKCLRRRQQQYREKN